MPDGSTLLLFVGASLGVVVQLLNPKIAIFFVLTAALTGSRSSHS